MNPAAAPRSLARLLITGNPALPSPAGGALPGPSAGAQRLRRPRQLGGAAAGRARAAPAGGLAAARHTPSLALTSGPSRRQPLPPSGTPLPQPQAHPTTHHVPTQTPTVSPRKHPPSPHANTRRVPLYDFFKTSLPPISPPKPPVTLVVAHSQGVPAFLQAGRTYLLTPWRAAVRIRLLLQKQMKVVAPLAPAQQPGTQPSGLWGWGGPQPASPEGVDPCAWHGYPRKALRLTGSPRNPCRGMNPEHLLAPEAKLRQC